ncbi:MAG: hypothetical protein K2X38_14340 [Gemmataceae bacterium]|nr:hypothetical protein [Gemmataceae bacterium]
MRREDVPPRAGVGPDRVRHPRRGPCVAGLLPEVPRRPAVAAWSAGPCHKVVCRVTNAEFEAAKAFEDSVVLTESALDGAEVAFAFRPREEWPKAFKFYRLYR